MNTKTWIGIGAAVAAGLTALGSATALAGRYEEPAWTLVDQVGDLEVRRYTATIQAQTMLGDGGQASDQGFRVLAGYIFGGNTEGESISMTTPVTMQPSADGEVMSFTMPSAYALEELPAPNDARVQIVEVPGGDFAALRFRGRIRNGQADPQVQDLLEQVAAAGLTPVSEPLVAQYNGPWTPGPLRRNEVLVQVQPIVE
jgi:DNA gyrase inhibitor GyrI